MNFAANFGLILVCLAIGILLKRTRALPAAAPVVLNSFVIWISVPAVALLNLHELTLDRSAFFPVSMAWILFAASWLFFRALGRLAGWGHPTVGALILTGGLCNTSFVGYPLLVALFGSQALRTGVLTDQPGSFLVLSSLGVLVASLYSKSSASNSGNPSRLAAITLKLLRFPPFLAMIVALALYGWSYPPALKEILEKLSATLVPLALVSVGLQMAVSPAALRHHAKELAAGLAFKLLLGPALILVLFVFLLGARGREIQITLVQSAMAPMITAGILAAEHGLEPELSNLMVGVGIPLSLLTVPLWAYALRWL